MANGNYSLSTIQKKIEDFIREQVGTKKIVIGLSGGLDSSVVVKLCVNAIDKDRVFGMILPSKYTPTEDMDDAINLAIKLQIASNIVYIQPIVDSFLKEINHNERSEGNIAARVRMAILYNQAFMNDGLVAGTSDKSELYSGYFTKNGDGAADFLPIADLYKTKVRELAKHLEIPSKIIEKRSSARLWDNHFAEEEMGITYEELDAILASLIDEHKAPLVITDRVQLVMDMIAKSEHKRASPNRCWI